MTLGLLLPLPQAAAAADRTPLVSVCTHFVPPPPKAVTARDVVVAFVVVELPTTRLNIVEEAFEINPCRMGFVLKTRAPALPVLSVIKLDNLLEVSIEEEEILLLKRVQLAEESLPLAEAEENGKLNV